MRPLTKLFSANIFRVNILHRGIFRSAILAGFLAFALPLCARGQQAPAAIATDPPVDKANPAKMEALQLPSHGALLNAIVYVAAGAGPHPVVILLHGFPGNEKNLDLAQAIRRAGWDAMYFNYRGSWGSPGDFSFTHSIEDTLAAIAYVRDPANAKKLRADPAHIVLIGHSMGGFMAVSAAAQDAKVEAIGMISAADMGSTELWASETGKEPNLQVIAAALADNGMSPLAGCTPESLAKEILDNHNQWAFPNAAAKLASRPILNLTSDDGLTATNDAFVAAVKKAGNANVTTVHMNTDHGYSDHRIALEKAVLAWLARLGKP